MPNLPKLIVLRIVCLLVLALAGAGSATAVQPDEMLKDPALEKRARHLSGQLRCLVCQNQSIDESNAPLARDLRLLVREHLKAGESDKEVIDYVVARYGEFVLLRPRFGVHTLLLWLAPVLLVVLGLWLIFTVWRRNRGRTEGAAAPPLSDTERARLETILRETGDKPNP